MINNITLIGMPTSGKTVIGKILSQHFQWPWVDTDHLIAEKYQKPISELLDEEGKIKFLEKENSIICGINDQQHIISTGGSAVYCKEAMLHLRNISKVFYLYIDYTTMSSRLGCLYERAVVKDEQESLAHLWEERHVLYSQYAHVMIDTRGDLPADTVQKIIGSRILR